MCRVRNSLGICFETCCGAMGVRMLRRTCECLTGINSRVARTMRVDLHELGIHHSDRN